MMVETRQFPLSPIIEKEIVFTVIPSENQFFYHISRDRFPEKADHKAFICLGSCSFPFLPISTHSTRGQSICHGP